eukprot:Nk52_evm14s217 gene=Nk52_evmTU14s217
MVRFKNRYLLVEVHVEGTPSAPNRPAPVRIGDEQLTEKILVRGIREAYREAWGDYGFGCVLQSLQIKQYNRKTGIAILRIARPYLEKLSTALCFLTVLDKKHCSLQTLHTSGTIRSCQKRLIEFQNRGIVAMKEVEKN